MKAFFSLIFFGGGALPISVVCGRGRGEDGERGAKTGHMFAVTHGLQERFSNKKK